MQIRIGTRASKLAMIQANIVAAKLGNPCEIIPIITSGDKELSKPLYDIGGKALFIKELEDALLADRIDMAVHSLKDVPGILPEGFTIAAILEREDPRDALVSKIANKISDLPVGAVVGTSSPRRMAYLMRLRPDLKLVNLRGNVDTRVGKIMSGELDAAILSYAGLKRLRLAPSDICNPIATSEIMPAIGQGAIAVETLKSKEDICSSLNHQMTSDLIQAERAFLEHIGADCRTPAAAFARIESGQMIVDFMLAENDLSRMVERRVEGELTDAYKIGRQIADWMKE
jgi:hydroxymethylbilane synthase